MDDGLFDWDDANILHLAEHDVVPEIALIVFPPIHEHPPPSRMYSFYQNINCSNVVGWRRCVRQAERNRRVEALWGVVGGNAAAYNGLAPR